MIYEEKRAIGFSFIQVLVELFHGADRLAIDFQNHISRFKSRLCGSRIRIHAANGHALRVSRDSILA